MLKKYLEKYLVFREKEIFFKYLKITYDSTVLFLRQVYSWRCRVSRVVCGIRWVSFLAVAKCTGCQGSSRISSLVSYT